MNMKILVVDDRKSLQPLKRIIKDVKVVSTRGIGDSRRALNCDVTMAIIIDLNTITDETVKGIWMEALKMEHIPILIAVTDRDMSARNRWRRIFDIYYTRPYEHNILAWFVMKEIGKRILTIQKRRGD